MATLKGTIDPLAIGIDIGGTGTKFGIVDRVGNVLFSGGISTKNMRRLKRLLMNCMII